MNSSPIPHSTRLKRLREAMQLHSCEAVLIEHPTNLFYLTGLDLSSGKLVVTQDHACLIVDGRYYESSQKQSLYPVQILKDDALKDWILDSRIHQLGFDPHQTSYHSYSTLQQLASKIIEKNHEFEIKPLEALFQNLRLIKDEWEIHSLRKSARLGYQGYEFVASLLREGVSESELAFELEFFWKKRGASKLAFDSIIAFGANSSMPHYRAGPSQLTSNTSVLIDIGVVLEHYHSDMTRVIFFGSPPPLLKTIYSIVEEAKEKSLASCRPGTLIGDLDQIARDWIASKGYGDRFTHSLGHGVGLDIHEPPLIREKGIYKDMPLQAGMVITIEPGIYLPNIGGVRLEDMILITNNGYENLTQTN